MTYHRGFAPIVLLIIAALLIGGTLYFKQTAQAPATPQKAPLDWETYQDPAGLYSISYPPNAIVLTSTSTFKYSGHCLSVYTKDFGAVIINTGDEFPCGGALYKYAQKYRLPQVSTSIDSQTFYSDWTYREKDNSSSLLVFSINPQMQVSYGVNSGDVTDPISPSKPLSDSEYQKALNSAQAIISTLKFR